jgi:hypothetical protein
MKGAKRPAFWSLLLGFALLAAWWAVEAPHEPDRLFRAVPAGATVVSAHAGIARRWDAISANPVSRSLLGAMGIKPAAAGADRETREWLARLASDEAVFAYVPTMGPEGSGAWVFASWVGGRSQRLRWMLSWGRMPGFRRVGVVHGWPVWSFRTARASDPDLMVALAEGMLVGCFSKRFQDAERVLNCLDGLVPSLASRPRGVGLPLERGEGAAPDQGWFEFYPPGAAYGRPARVGFSFSRLEASEIAGIVSLPEEWMDVRAPLAGRAASVPERILGGGALATVIVDGNAARDWLRSSTNTAPGWVASQFVDDAQGSLLVGLFGGEYSGRFRGIKLPTMVAGVRAGERGVDEKLDRLNARYQWGLVPRSLSAGPTEVFAIVGTSTNLYAGLDLREVAAYAAIDDWLLFASNLGGFTNLLADALSVAEKKPKAAGGRFADEEGAALSGWIDLAEGGKAVRLAITAWSLKLMMTDPDGSRALRDRLSEAKAWIDTMAPLRQIRFSLKQGDRGSEIHFHAGGAEPGGS